LHYFSRNFLHEIKFAYKVSGTIQFYKLKEKKMRIIILSLFLFCSLRLLGFDYTVEFEGIKEKEVLTSLHNASQTIALREKKPLSTYQALRKRAESDSKKLIEVCHYYGYLTPQVTFIIARSVTPKVIFKISLGPLFTIKSYSILPQDIYRGPPLLSTDMPARTEKILEAEDLLIATLKNEGYAFSKIVKKDVVADIADNSVTVTFFVDTGGKVRFGKTQISGNTSVKTSSLLQHLRHKKGKLYSKAQLDLAQQNLEKTGLFSSVYIREAQEQFSDDELPIEIMLQEAKHKSIGLGASYTSSKGPGASCLWENRNLFGEGNRLTFQADVWKKFQNAKIGLREPHYKHYNQDRLWLAEFDRQETISFFSQAISASSLLERHFHGGWDGFWGGKLESLHSSGVDESGHYVLLKAPLGIKWSNVANLLDPAKGITANIKVTPSWQCLEPHFGYVTHVTTLSLFCPLFSSKNTGAAKFVVGNIFGASKHTIPMPDRFFSGTENTLRGYRYLSVSPLNDQNKPVGGRSEIAASFEARFRTETNFGWVIFYDVGNVWANYIPPPKLNLLHSVGIGLRYATPIGPLRLDCAVPLKRRPSIDPPFQVYFSIGQAF
jgi:translocation and assembly module TamA